MRVVQPPGTCRHQQCTSPTWEICSTVYCSSNVWLQETSIKLNTHCKILHAPGWCLAVVTNLDHWHFNWLVENNIHSVQLKHTRPNSAEFVAIQLFINTVVIKKWWFRKNYLFEIVQLIVVHGSWIKKKIMETVFSTTLCMRHKNTAQWNNRLLLATK